MRTTKHDASDFVQLLREFLDAHARLVAIFERYGSDDIPFSAVQSLVGDNDEYVLFRLKERSHTLFRSEGSNRSEAVRREALFDLVVGSLFHESMKLRESLYQREFYAPRIASLRRAGEEDATGEGDEEDLFLEFERILSKSASRIHEVIAEVRILLAQTRDQLRRLLVERSAERVVARFLLGRREEVSAAFPEGFKGILESMYGDEATGLVEAGRSLLDSAYYAESIAALREASTCAGAPKIAIQHLLLYAEGMKAFLEGDYGTSLSSLESWLDSGAAEGEREAGRAAAAALSRLDRIVSGDSDNEHFASRAKELQLRLDNASR